jgi:eukaryotic-like serine/threonine-protein kinase
MTPQTQPPVPGDLIAERYRVVRALGQGGMGVVVEAENIVTGKRVALKWLRSSQSVDVAGMQRLVREARVAARVRHPNLIDIYDVGDHAGALFLVEELLEGQPLSTALGHGPVAHPELLATLMPVLEGLAAAHRQGVVHRDIKPSNIFLCVDDRGQPLAAKLLDFGTSTVQRQTEHATEPTLTDTGSVVGTPQFMAPEQLDEARSVDARADIYSLGVLLYRALSGVLPYQADSYSTLVLRIASGEHAPLAQRCPQLPAELVAVIEKAMARDRDARFADVGALSIALRPFAGRSTLNARRESRASPIPLAFANTEVAAPDRHPKYRGTRVAGVVAVGIVLAATLLGLWWWRVQPVPLESRAADNPQRAVAPSDAPTAPSAALPQAQVHAASGGIDATEPISQPAQHAVDAVPDEPKQTRVRGVAPRRHAPSAQTRARSAQSKPSDPLDLRSDEF